MLYFLHKSASWRKRLPPRVPPQGSRVQVSVTPYGFRGGRNGVWVGFSWNFSRFPLPQIYFHHFSNSSHPFHFINPCDGARRGRPAPLLFTDLNIGHGRLARWITWRACDAGEAKEGLENGLWRRWSNGRVEEWAVTWVKWRKGWRMSFDVGEVTESLENELCYVTVHSPTLLSLLLRHKLFI